MVARYRLPSGCCAGRHDLDGSVGHLCTGEEASHRANALIRGAARGTGRLNMMRRAQASRCEECGRGHAGTNF